MPLPQPNSDAPIKLPIGWSAKEATEDALQNKNFGIKSWMLPCQDASGNVYKDRFHYFSVLIQKEVKHLNGFALYIKTVCDHWLSIENPEDWAERDAWIDATSNLIPENHADKVRLTSELLFDAITNEKREMFIHYMGRFPHRWEAFSKEHNLFKRAKNAAMVDILIDHGYEPTPQRVNEAIDDMIANYLVARYEPALRLLMQPSVTLSHLRALTKITFLHYSEAEKTLGKDRAATTFVLLAHRLLDFCTPPSGVEKRGYEERNRTFFQGDLEFGPHLIKSWLIQEHWPVDNFTIVPLFERMIKDFGLPFDPALRSQHPAAEALAQTLELKAIADQRADPRALTSILKPQRRT